MRIIKIFAVFVVLAWSFWVSFAAINMTVSPIKYELTWAPWTSVTKTATLYNHDSAAIPITTAKSDFISNGTTGGPSFVRYSELVHADQQMSSWITLSSSGFTIAANGKKTIEFTIDIPTNATPGWHYAAVFFQNNNSESSWWWWTKLGINVDYAIIILLTVSWEVNTEIEIIDPIISNNWWYTKSSKEDYNLNWWNKLWYWNTIDNCLWDFTNSNFDGKCYDNPVDLLTNKWDWNTDIKKELDNAINLNNSWTWDVSQNTNSWENNNINNINWDKEEKEKFEIEFTFPIKNTGNTHVKPKWTIKLIDEDWKVIKWVWKKNKYNKLWAVIGVDVVDYLPINDNGWNVLPQSQRNFWEKWEWFPYQTLNADGKIVMRNMSPEEYYTKQNIWSDRVLMPWERVCFRKNNKNIKALINIVYTDDNGEEVEYSSAKEIPVTYTEKYIGINPYIVLPLLLFIWLLFLLWIIALWKRTRCINKDCKKRIKRKLLRCPHCDTKQKKTSNTKIGAKKSKKKVEKKVVAKKKSIKKNKKK